MTEKKQKKSTEKAAAVFKNTIKTHPLLTFFLILMIAASVIIGVTPPLVLEHLIDALNSNNSRILSLVLLYFGLTAASGFSDAGKEILITVFGQKITHETRSVMSKKLVRLPASYFIDQESGVTTSRFVNDVNTVEDLFSSGVISMASNAFQIVSIMVVVFHLSRGLFLMLLIALPLLFLMTRAFQKRMLKAQIDNRVADGRTNQQIPETIHNQRTIFVLRIWKYMERKYHRFVRDGFDAVEKSNFYDSIYSPIILSISALIIGIMMSLSVSSSRVQALFGMSVGTVVALIAYVGKVFDPLSDIGMEIQNIQSAAAGIHRISEFLNEEERVFPENNKSISVQSSDAPAIRIKNVSFGYEPDSEILHNFSLDVQKGETVTLTGRTGIGKSTCFKLILGLYPLRKGKIEIFGIPVENLSDEDRKKTIGCVEQKFSPVEGTIRDQITLGDPSVGSEMIDKSLEITGLKDVVSQFPDGLDTLFKNGMLSQGQLQLLSIARAVVRNPKILLLDEITANLDSATETQIMKALAEASENRTVLSISHRLFEQTGGRQIEMESQME